MRVLLSNDDGIDARGLRALVNAAIAHFPEVLVVAPAHEQSAMSHALTLSRPLRLRAVDKGTSAREFALEGTPADCIYVALHDDDLGQNRPDLVISGVNHGPNLGRDVHYSGTVAAAREAALRGVLGLAVSLLGEPSDEAFSGAAALAVKVGAALAGAQATGLFNLNIPCGASEVVVTRLGQRIYDERIVRRVDPRGHDYLWIGGPNAPAPEMTPGTDTFAVSQSLASLTPLKVDVYDAERADQARAILRALTEEAIELPAT